MQPGKSDREEGNGGQGRAKWGPVACPKANQNQPSAKGWGLQHGCPVQIALLWWYSNVDHNSVEGDGCWHSCMQHW